MLSCLWLDKNEFNCKDIYIHKFVHNKLVLYKFYVISTNSEARMIKFHIHIHWVNELGELRDGWPRHTFHGYDCNILLQHHQWKCTQMPWQNIYSAKLDCAVYVDGTYYSLQVINLDIRLRVPEVKLYNFHIWSIYLSELRVGKWDFITTTWIIWINLHVLN